MIDELNDPAVCLSEDSESKRTEVLLFVMKGTDEPLGYPVEMYPPHHMEWGKSAPLRSGRHCFSILASHSSGAELVVFSMGERIGVLF